MASKLCFVVVVDWDKIVFFFYSFAFDYMFSTWKLNQEYKVDSEQRN